MNTELHIERRGGRGGGAVLQEIVAWLATEWTRNLLGSIAAIVAIIAGLNGFYKWLFLKGGARRMANLFGATADLAVDTFIFFAKMAFGPTTCRQPLLVFRDTVQRASQANAGSAHCFQHRIRFFSSAHRHADYVARRSDPT